MRQRGGTHESSSRRTSTLGDSERVMALLCGVRGANRLVVRRRLLEQIQRAGLQTRDIS